MKFKLEGYENYEICKMIGMLEFEYYCVKL